MEDSFFPRPENYREYLCLLSERHSLRKFAGKIEASDVVQEALLRAHENQQQFQGHNEKEYRCWLQKILSNVIAANARKFLSKKRNVALENSIYQSIHNSSCLLESLQNSAQKTPSQLFLNWKTFKTWPKP